MALIEMKGVAKKYHRSTTALRDINVSINPGEFVYIVGPSGAGKSSFIKLLYREEKVSAGTLKVGEFNLTKMKKRQIPILRRSIGVVFQDYKLLPKKTVFENVAYAMQVIGEKPREIKKRVPEVLELVGLKHKMRSFPDQLSGGEQQRVAIARALAMKPKILCYDEPTSALDPNLRDEVAKLILGLKKDGMTQLVVTHDMEFAQKVADDILQVKALDQQ